jgi:hypothetical protein
MTLDGIWTVEIYGVYGWESTGVIILEGGRALRGGNNHFSVGTCEISSYGQISISLFVEYHGHVRTMFGESQEKFSVNFEGKFNDPIIEGTLGRPDRVDMKITCRLTKCGDVPAIPN